MSARPASPSRKRQVLAGLARGLGAAGIAAELGLSTHTVREYIKDVYEELGAHTSGQAVARGFALGWIGLGEDRLVVVPDGAVRDLVATAVAVGRGSPAVCPVRARRGLDALAKACGPRL